MPDTPNESRKPNTDSRQIARDLIEALIAERDDPRNAVEHTGFREGMTRAIAVIRMALEV